MIDIEKRLRRTFSSMAANESLADGLTEDAASNMLKWGETIAKQFVLKTSTMEDDMADEFLAPYSSALRKMMRALGHWVVETDQEVRLEWWNRIEQNGKTLYGDRFVLPALTGSLVAFSLGDILLACGAGWLLWSLGGQKIGRSENEPSSFKPQWSISSQRSQPGSQPVALGSRHQPALPPAAAVEPG